MTRYKLARIVNGKYLSANQGATDPDGTFCLEYRVGEITSTGGVGVACYKKKENALTDDHIRETRNGFNDGKPITLLTLRPIGRPVFSAINYGIGMSYEGGINYRSVEVLKAVQVKN